MVGVHWFISRRGYIGPICGAMAQAQPMAPRASPTQPRVAIATMPLPAPPAPPLPAAAGAAEPAPAPVPVPVPVPAPAPERAGSRKRKSRAPQRMQPPHRCVRRVSPRQGLLHRFWDGREEVFAELLGTDLSGVCDSRPSPEEGARRFVRGFRPSTLQHIRVVTKVCAAVPALGRQLLRVVRGRTGLEDYLRLWVPLGAGDYPAFVEGAVALISAIHLHHPAPLRRWMVRCCNQQKRYVMTERVLHCLNHDTDDLNEPFALGLGLLAVLLQRRDLRRELTSMLCCEYVLLPNDMDALYQSHQHLLLRLDDSLMHHPLMARLVIGRSATDLHRAFMRTPCMERGMRQVLLEYMNQTLLDANHCKAIFLVGSWFADSDTDLLSDTINKAIHMLVSVPQRFLIPRVAMDRLLRTISKLMMRTNATSRRINMRMLGRWAIDMLPNLRHWRFFELVTRMCEQPGVPRTRGGRAVKTRVDPGAVRRAVRVGLRMAIDSAECLADGDILEEEQLRAVCRGCRHLLARVTSGQGEAELVGLAATAINVLAHAAAHPPENPEDHPSRDPAALAACAEDLLAGMRGGPAAGGAAGSLDLGAALRAAPKHDPAAVARLRSAPPPPAAAPAPDATPPDRFLCSLLCEVMRSPVRLPASKVVVDRGSLRRHLRQSKTDPYSNTPLTEDMAEECAALREEIRRWRRGTAGGSGAAAKPPAPRRRSGGVELE